MFGSSSTLFDVAVWLPAIGECYKCGEKRFTFAVGSRREQGKRQDSNGCLGIELIGFNFKMRIVSAGIASSMFNSTNLADWT